MKRVLETNNWKYNGETVVDLSQIPEKAFGFIYQITNNLTGKKYIGKKQLYSVRKKPVKPSSTAGRKRFEYVKSESDWQRYWGSDKNLLAEIKEKGKENFTKEILYFVTSKYALTYYETKEIFSRGAIEPGSEYLNDNILGKFFPKIFESGSKL